MGLPSRLPQWWVKSSGSQSGAPGQASVASPTKLSEMKILQPAPDILRQKLWLGGGGCPALGILTSPPYDSELENHNSVAVQ